MMKDAKVASQHTPEPNEPPTCIKCGDEYLLPDGYEITAYCNPCAQEIAPALLEALESLMIAYGASDGRNGNSGECWDKCRAAIALARGDRP